MNDSYKKLSNLKKSDIPEKMVDPIKQTVIGFPAISNAFNKFFVSVSNASDNHINGFTDTELKEIEISVEMAKEFLNA